MLRKFAKFVLWMAGWKAVGEPVLQPKGVLVIAYHTSNWDALPCFGFNVTLNANVTWVGKKSIFWWPLGAFLRSIGGIPVTRNANEDFVSQMVNQFRSRDHFVLAMAPEGTRKRTHNWKTGFYHIARTAGVPVQIAALDYKNKAFVFSPLIHLTGDEKQDINHIREFLRPIEPKNPHLADRDFEFQSS